MTNTTAALTIPADEVRPGDRLLKIGSVTITPRTVTGSWQRAGEQVIEFDDRSSDWTFAPCWPLTVERDR